MKLDSNFIKIILFFSLFLNIYSQNSIIKAKDLNTYCEKNIYKIIIDIDINNPLQDYVNFYLTMDSKQNLLFKCIIDPYKKKIICITNLASHKVELKPGDRISFPYPFPEIKGIVWDYRSFLFRIFRRTIYLEEGCGEPVIKNNITNLNPTKWDLIAKINKIYDGKCLLSDVTDNFFSFKMNLDIIGGNLKESLKEDDSEIIFLQNITMPFKIRPFNSLESVWNYIVHEYYKFAFCSPLKIINSTNYEKEEGFDFICKIPISDQYIFNGPLRITTFSDNVYSSISEEDKTDFISIYFTTDQNPRLKDNNEIIDEGEEEEEEEAEDNEEDSKEDNKQISLNDNDKKEKDEKNLKNKNAPISSQSLSSSTQSSSPQSSSQSSSSSVHSSVSELQPVKSSSSKSPSSIPPSPSGSNLRSLQIVVGNKKKKSYLLLDNRRTYFVCPDKPIFEITSREKGIKYEPIIGDENKYNVILTGYLKNGYKISSNKLTVIDYTQDEIKFDLSITNNLIEESTERKTKILCSLSSGTMFLEKQTTQIKCTGDKKLQKNNKITDITLNWLSKENKYLNDIVIKWPKDIRINSKKLYSYSIDALSISKEDYDCYDDKYYFYINIYDLKSEPEINFELKMLKPLYSTAKCKLYTSRLLKCYLDLRLRKISKGTKIRIPMPGNYNITTREGNYINLTILNFVDGNGSLYADEGIITDESCGNNKYVGAIQNIGYGYAAAITIIVLFIALVCMLYVCIMYCTCYELANITRKGYYPHVDERKEIKNVSTSSFNQSGQP